VLLSLSTPPPPYHSTHLWQARPAVMQAVNGRLEGPALCQVGALQRQRGLLVVNDVHATPVVECVCMLL
jgi:hypothetical protein